MGNKTEARIISKLAKEVAGQSFNTLAQNQYDSIHNKRPDLEKLQSQAVVFLDKQDKDIQR